MPSWAPDSWAGALGRGEGILFRPGQGFLPRPCAHPVTLPVLLVTGEQSERGASVTGRHLTVSGNTGDNAAPAACVRIGCVAREDQRSSATLPAER